MTVPLVPVVAVSVAVPPLGAVNANVTVAPETGEPPFVTVAVIGTVPGVGNLEADTETVAASEGGFMTVRLAVPEPTYELFDAFASAK